MGIPIIGDLINVGAQMLQNKSNRRWEQKMYEKQKQDSIQFWNMQNEYNSPEAQMRRFKQAGLNPNLIYGQSNTSDAIKGPSMGSPNTPAPQVSTEGIGDMVNTYFNVQKSKQEVDNLKKQNEIMDKNLQLMDQTITDRYWSALNRSQDYNMKGLDYEIKGAQSKALKSIPDAQLQNMIKEGRIKDVDLKTKNTYNRYQTSLLDSQLSVQKARVDQIENDIESERAFRGPKLDLLSKEVYDKKMSGLLKDFQMAESQERKNKIGKEIKLIMQKARIAEKDADYYEIGGVSNFLKSFKK